MLQTLERALRYQRIHGTRRFVREVLLRLLRRVQRLVPGLAGTGSSVAQNVAWTGARELVAAQSRACSALRLFQIPAAEVPRISMVTDSINRGSLYGGVGTAIILAALLARTGGARLRIITRTEPANPSGLAQVLATYGIALDHEVEFAYAPWQSDRYQIDRFPAELFITTSWWTTAATLGAVESSAVVYLLQEDERMFYPHGDEHLRCSRILARQDIRFIVNTRMLHEHLLANGLPHLTSCGQWFEPAFPPGVFHPPAPGSVRPARRRLLFYARPNNLRNLFHFGLDVLETAIARGLIDLDSWELVLVGKDLPPLRFDEGRYIPLQIENLNWSDYAAMARSTDLALCLMYTPHPSYPPFDLAASGAVVVTNRFGNKQDLSHYCANILCAEPDIESMLQALSEGLQLACDTPRREANFRAHRLGVDWSEAFADVIRKLGGAA